MGYSTVMDRPIFHQRHPDSLGWVCPIMRGHLVFRFLMGWLARMLFRHTNLAFAWQKAKDILQSVIPYEKTLTIQTSNGSTRKTPISIL